MILDSHLPLEVSAKQRRVLATLAEILYSHVVEHDGRHNHFDMAVFIRDADRNRFVSSSMREKQVVTDEVNICETAACAAGWGAVFHKQLRVKVPADVNGMVDWVKFIKILLGTESGPSVDFLFAGFWSGVDDTPKGAAKRIWYALTHGVPVPADSYDNLWRTWALTCKGLYDPIPVEELRRGHKPYPLAKLPKFKTEVS